MTPPRPEALEVRPRNIPQALKDVAGWVMWRWWWDGNRWTKPPYSVEGVKIDEGDPENWTDFSTALQAYQGGGFDGIGISLNAIPELAGADLDHCIQGGKIEPWALEIIEELGSYAEISPSGTGLRILGYGRLRRKGRKRGNIEVYDSGRYLTCTGHRLDGSAFDLVDFDEALDELHRRIWPEAEKESTPHDDECEVGEDLAERFQAFLDDDPIFRERFNTPAAVGDRSDHEFHLCAKLYEEGFSASEIRSLMDSSPQEKWRARDDAYKEGTIREAVRRAIASDRGRGCGATAVDKARVFIEKTVKEALKEDPRKLKDREVLAALLTLREKDPLEFDLLTDELKGAGVVKLPTLKKMIDGEERRQADEKAQEEEAGERLEIAPDVEREADQILSAGLAFEYLYETWQARHLGDAKVGKALLGGFGAQRCSSTEGIHIQVNGPREAGKSHAVETAIDLLPPRLVMMGSMSNMTLYYDAENMPAGAAVSIDDITYTETFGAVQKRCTTGFQTGATHRSVVDSKDGKVVKKFTTKPRMAFYTTCVDRQQDEQLRSRLWSIDADSSPEHKQAVIDFRKKKDAGLLFDPAEEERKTAVCRAIFEDLDSRLFDVVIPYAERLVTSPGLDVRSYNVISDLTKSLAVYRYRVREKDDRGRVLATEKDFFDAKAIFDATEGHSDIKFTDAELMVLEALADLGFKASMSDLCRKTGLSKSRVDEILNGRGKGEQKRHGLMSKAPITREQESDSWTYDHDPDTGDFRRKTVTQFIYYLDPSFRLQGYKSLIKLETDNGGEVSGGFRKVSVVVSVDDNDNGKEVSGVSVEKTEEEDDNVLPLRGAVGRDGEDISSNTCPGKTTETTESPSPLAVRTTETSPETTETPRKPQEQKGDEEGRVFGLTHAYYRDLQRQTGGLSIKVLMDLHGWDRERADMAMGMLRAAGVVE